MFPRVNNIWLSTMNISDNYHLKPESTSAMKFMKSRPRPPVHIQQSTFDTKSSSTQPTEPIMNTLQQLVQVQTRQAELSALLTKQHVTNHLPVKEPPTFSGNVFDYPAFITAFDSIICDNVLTNKDRLYFLNKYTIGQANEVVKGFLAVNSDMPIKRPGNCLMNVLVIQCMWLKPISLGCVIGLQLRTAIVRDCALFLISWFAVKRL